jgi:hypothetical protein
VIDLTQIVLDDLKLRLHQATLSTNDTINVSFDSRHQNNAIRVELEVRDDYVEVLSVAIGSTRQCGTTQHQRPKFYLSDPKCFDALDAYLLLLRTKLFSTTDRLYALMDEALRG